MVSTDNNTPLFEPGFHEIELNRFEEVFVTPFNDSTHRKYLLDRFLAFLSVFNAIGINCEIWVDGSFATTKNKPSDIDIIFFYNFLLS